MPNTTPAPIGADALRPIITWLDNGCDPKQAAEELRLLVQRADALASAAQPEREPHPPHRDCGCTECAPSFEPDAADPRAAPAPAAVVEPSWSDAANWLRSNYQDYPNIASLCEGMIAASPYANAAYISPIHWENAMPGGKYTDEGESTRVADYNRGWNDYRKEAHKKLKAITAPTVQAARQPGVNVWQQAIDHELVTAHLGVAGPATLEEARKAVRELILWNIDVDANLATAAPAPAAQGDALDTARLNYLIESHAIVVSDPDSAPGYWLEFISPGADRWVQIGEYPTPRAAIDAARAAKEGGSNA